MSKSCNSLYNRNSSSIIQDRTDYDKHMITLFSTPQCNPPVYGPGGQAPQPILGPGGTLQTPKVVAHVTPQPVLGPGGTLQTPKVAAHVIAAQKDASEKSQAAMKKPTTFTIRTALAATAKAAHLTTLDQAFNRGMNF